MAEDLQVLALLFSFFILTIGLYHLFSIENKSQRNRKKRELIYRAEMFPFKKSGPNHIENRLPALYRIDRGATRQEPKSLT